MSLNALLNIPLLLWHELLFSQQRPSMDSYTDSQVSKAINGRLCKALGIRLVTNPLVVQLARNAGFDALFIDLEHSTFSLADASAIACAGLLSGLLPYARLPYQCGMGYVQQVLDGGAIGVIFPHVVTAADARAAVDACKFPPVGRRSLWGQQPALGLRQTPLPKLIDICNARGSSVVVMIETVESIDNIDAIADVEGVDMLLVGCLDLSTDMGSPGLTETKEFRMALETVGRACRRRGKTMGIAGLYNNPKLHDWAINELGVLTRYSQEPIAVIGMACRFPGGSNSPSKLWDLIRSPRDLSQRVPKSRFDPEAYFHANGSYHGATDSRNAYFLDEDVALFDNAFFSIQPAEAEAIDPQQRLLMETVYDSLCAGGQTIEALRGSDTAVYVGMMCDDWAQLINRDWEATLTYAATGESRAIISNRVSYYFDWHGPSMTVDTACSSSLVAVHQGVTALRNGESKVAIAAGANLILSPGMWIAESNLHMLSPTGSSKMWDASADGYARGEGIAAVVMKKLSDALRDGDPIECIIRGTGVNQDGRTAGLTMPNNAAQAELIRDTYARAGLDITNERDRPQFFHAHGTGTQAGDPQEAQAISSSFFPDSSISEKLIVGSIKTVIGHTEGSAGLASLIGTAMALKTATIPPNLHFKNLNPRVAPYYSHLEIPTSARFGGTNAHAILEAYEPEAAEQTAVAPLAVPVFTPFTVSAASSTALRTMLDDLKVHLDSNREINMRDLAYTLQARRSTLAYRTVFKCDSVEEAITRIDGLLADDAAGEKTLTTRRIDVPNAKVLGVFTGQGAQWPRMGAKLIESSPFVAKTIDELDCALAQLPESDRPTWTLRSEMLAEPKSSRLSEAAIAQPLCTAVQIVLVNLLRAANIKLSGVVGHSSGEIGAAYAAGFLSATNAIYIAYYRGLYAHLAGTTGDLQGAMMAVGTTYEDALDLCELDDYTGRIQVAARNSSTSVTLSGDEDAIDEAEAIFKDESKFARRLRVDTAYHSRHMIPCVTPYLEALARCNVTAQEGNGIPWFSSVIDGYTMTKKDVQNPQYWVENMLNTVLFKPAVSDAVSKLGQFDMAVEFGPHPALKGPCLDTIEEATGKKVPYTGLLGRGKNDVDELAMSLGFLWRELGAGSVDFDAFERLISTASQPKRVVPDLPSYPFDHPRPFYALTRYSGGFKHVRGPPHPLLGRRCVETETESEISWRQLLRPNEISWLQGHQLQGQAVFPAMGYVAMAVEAVAALAGPHRKLGLINLEQVVIGRALTFGDDNAGVESRVSVGIERFTEEELVGRISCHSGLPYDAGTPLALNFNAVINVVFHEPEADTLPACRIHELNLVHADSERLYSQFTSLGYNYATPFTGVRKIDRKMDFAVGEIEDESGDAWEDQLLIHPGFLDSSIQTGFAAYCHPHDNRLWALHIPTSIRSISINPYFFSSPGASRNRTFQYQASTHTTPEIPMVVDIDIFAGSDEAHPYVQFESVGVKPFAAATARDDACVFSRTEYRIGHPDASAAVEGSDEVLLPENSVALLAAERIGFFHLRCLHESISDTEKAKALPQYQRLLEYAGYMIDAVSSGQYSTVPREAMSDSTGFIRSLIAKHRHHTFVKILEVVGQFLEDEVRSGGNMLDHLTQDGLLDQFYEDLAGRSGSESASTWFGRILGQLAHRFPRMHIIEIGAGAGGATSRILSSIDDAYESYTYTDVSEQCLQKAEDRFQKHSSRMVFSKFDMEKSPVEQGYAEEAYDVVLAAATLHSVADVEVALANIRRLLKPGGYLIVGDVVKNNLLSLSTILGCLPVSSPCLSLERWDTLAHQHGFGGIETHTPVAHDLQYYSVFACQAMDSRVRLLRAPLAEFDADSALPHGHLVVIGGRRAAVATLVREISTLLKPRYETITHVSSLEEVDASQFAPGCSVLCLAELDQQLLEKRTASKLESLKTLWRNGRNILYVTRGARANSPYSAMVAGVSRVVRFEYPNINLQVIDFEADPDVESTPLLLAESLVRLELGCRWLRDGSDDDTDINLLWNLEPEIYYNKEGKPLIPRVMPVADANKRFNTYRRVIQEEANPRQQSLVLEASESGQVFELSCPSPLRRLPAPRSSKTRTIKVGHSLLQAVKVPGTGFVGICAGSDIKTGETVVALLNCPTESRVQALDEWTRSMPSNGADIDASHQAVLVATVAADLFAQSILATVPTNGTVLVHEADEMLKHALDRQTMSQGSSLRFIFTTATKPSTTKGQEDTGSQDIYIHQRLPLRHVQCLIPRTVSCFVNLSPACASAELLIYSLPSNTPKFSVLDFARPLPDTDTTASVDDASQYLERALISASRSMQRQAAIRPTQQQPERISLKNVTGLSVTQAKHNAVVDWNVSSVQVYVRPIDHGVIFRPDATYLLFGLAGELGQSLCTWMVAHGARNIVLGSRKPNVDPLFLSRLAEQGATVKVMSVDLSDRSSLHACHAEVVATMPPVAGVANGALVLSDALFDDLDFESLDRTAKPKVDGSALLDELFYDDASLDFFILFTSAVCVSGNTGQSAYIMANTFMAALAAQRRDVRGVVGSDIALAAVAGLGHFEHSDHLDRDHFSKMGYQDSSEQDFHRLFAEAVLVGRPENSSKFCSQIASGLKPVRRAPNVQAQLRDDPRFSHFILPDASASLGRHGGDGANGGKALRPRVQLASVKTRGEARAVVRDAFVERLKRVLMVPQDEVLDENITLVEQGVDSIVAVEVRTWFLSELEVDLPVLKILGAGSTVQSLIDEALERLPASILDWAKLEDGDAAQVQPESSKPLALPPPLPMPLSTKRGLERANTAPAVLRLEASKPVKAPSEASSVPSSSSSSSGAETPLELDVDASASLYSQPSLAASVSTSLTQPTPCEEPKEEPNLLADWRKSIIAASTEHTEQMTYGQKRFWFLAHYIDDPTTFNAAFLAKLTGTVRVEELSRAVEAVAQQHEALRTRFFWSTDDDANNESKTPMQGILSKPLVRLETGRLASHDEATAELHAMRDHEWDLGDWVPVRLRLLSLSDTVHYLLMGTHHISLDGHSFTIMMMDIEKAYHYYMTTSSPRSNPLPPLPESSQARAFGNQQRIAYESGKFQPAIDAYRSMIPIATLQQPIELFPFARSPIRTPLDEYNTHTARRVLDKTLVASLKQLARANRATSFHAYLAALQALVFSLLPSSGDAGSTDHVFIGMADANRLDSRFMGSIGNFLNVLPIRFDRNKSSGSSHGMKSQATFGAAIEDAREKANQALEYSALPFDLLLDELSVPRSNSWAPIFQIFIDYRLVPGSASGGSSQQRKWAGCTVSDETWFPSRSGYDVVLEIKEDANETSLQVHVQRSLYDAQGAELFMNSFVSLLEQVTGEKRRGRDVELKALSKWAVGDIEKALVVGNVAHRIDEVIAQHPEDIALKDGHGHVLTYAELDRRVESIASALVENLSTSSSKQEHAIVGVFQMPTADYICSLLAIHRAGAVYLPLDMRNGTARLASNVKLAQPAAILTDTETAKRINELELSPHVVTIDVSKQPASTPPGSTKIQSTASSDNPAYIIFTSGSTGEAKGIVVTHASLRANLEGFHRAWSIDRLAKVTLQQAAFSFDASLLQIYAALTTGGCLVVVPADARGDPYEVTRLMAEHGVTMTQATPSEYDMWFRFAPDNIRRCTAWQAAWFGGERASQGVLDGFRNACSVLPNLRVFTSYGPTECTISAMKGEANVRDPNLTVPVPGRLLPNYAAYIVDEDLKPVPLGVPGEILLGGVGVGRNEYLQRPDLTATAFQTRPFSLPPSQTTAGQQHDTRIYRTGDYGRLTKEGLLTIEGRIAGDTQVKLRGFRIELAEIERVMITEAAGCLSQAVVTLRESHGENEKENEAFLAAHIVLESNSPLSSIQVVDKLRARLPLCIPQYMCPAIIVPLHSIPLTAHAKVDRKAIQALSLPDLVPDKSPVELERTLSSTQRRLASLWIDVLPPSHQGAPPLTQSSDFFLAGGNSLLLVKLQASIKGEFGDAPRLSKLMSAPLLASMAALLDEMEVAVDWEEEIAFPRADLPCAFVKKTGSTARQGLCVLVTGATGHLGRSIVAQLVANKRVSRLVCLVRPAEGRELTPTALFPNIGQDANEENKIHIIEADLPVLVSASNVIDQDILSQIDTVLHCAANRTFWDSYTAAKPVNVDAVKALVNLCLGTGAPLHVLSSGAVSSYESPDNLNLPRPNAADGYVASKWVTERYLANAARQAGVQVTLHRPTQLKSPKAQVVKADSEMAMKDTLVREMLIAAPRLGMQPDFARLGGWMDVAPLQDVAIAIVAAVTTAASTDSESSQAQLQVAEYPGVARVHTDALAAAYAAALEVDEAKDKDSEGIMKDVRGLPIVSGLQFVGAAKRAGMFEWVVAAQEIVMKDGKGAKVVAKR
ncbi:hypothetical protein BD289DRAFT_453499 [Coniella lustricola]|uniref:Polyketide synthase n=1 Tax=Coniella lustricola TaxID=2025994 RepID=A0A2T3A775_9PEZI|nr:hypothetical protein BD289DRAFT_453499 [Coniella lustricola]